MKRYINCRELNGYRLFNDCVSTVGEHSAWNGMRDDITSAEMWV